MTTETQATNVNELIKAGTIARPPVELTQKLKEEWGRDGTELTLTSSEFMYDQEGKGYFRFHAQVGDQKVTFALGCNGKRDQWLHDIEQALTTTPISGLRLKTYDGSGPTPRVELEPVDAQ